MDIDELISSVNVDSRELKARLSKYIGNRTDFTRDEFFGLIRLMLKDILIKHNI